MIIINILHRYLIKFIKSRVILLCNKIFIFNIINKLQIVRKKYFKILNS